MWPGSSANRTALALALGALLFAGGATAYITSKHVWATEQLAQLEPRYARLVGLGESGPAIDAALVERRNLLARNVYPPTQDVARAGSDGLQRARDVFVKAGLEVTSSQVLAPKEVEGFDRIPLVLQVGGELAAFQAALIVLPSQGPSLFIEGFNVQAAGMRPDGPQRITVQVKLFVLRARQ